MDSTTPVPELVPPAAKFRQADIRRAINAVAKLGFEEIRVAIRLDGSLEVMVRRNVVNDLPEEELD
jgi:hypothetical protein